MAVKKKTDIGFNRLVRSAWLRDTLRLVAAEVPETEIEEQLKEAIAVENSGKETIRKVFVHLRRVWIDPPRYCLGLRNDALDIFRSHPDAQTSFLLNWGMCIAAYPFIGCVAEATGRLFRLQGDAQAKQVNLRVRERFGDRHFVRRSVRYNLSTFLDMGAVQTRGRPGEYIRGKTLQPRNDRETAWLVEALLHSREEPSLPLQALSKHATLFPFDLGSVTAGQLRTNPRLQLTRHGLDADLVEVK